MKHFRILSTFKRDLCHSPGLSREINYARDGLFKWNALKFSLPLSESVNLLHFHWRADRGDSIGYSLVLTSSDPVSLYQPHLNISHSGMIPVDKEQIWRVTLPCSGRKTATVVVTIEVRLTGLPPTPGGKTSETLILHRQKKCSADAGGGGATSSSADGTGDGGSSDSVHFSAMGSETPPHMVFVGVLLAAMLGK